MKYEFIEFNCPKCGKYNNIYEKDLYSSDDDIICNHCKAKLDIDFKLDDYDEIIEIIITEL